MNKPEEVTIGYAVLFGIKIPLIAREGYFGLTKADIKKVRKEMKKV